ncbi:Gfo/Idh/MocA family oxidoreductase [Rhizobium sp. NFR03]|uniref:Gfo/Idh/MocA family protein n=1 Tax=Rhizobium sp. NFR03 TaxID=1566263 RepID=UPI0008BAECA5|nr:Gfo/Idh/MocA family oxidoreductase [Rhizobium sp. NFR03]SER87926.1 Predicted dehydrogenase [Rhizobium sp. NFR03]
MPSFRGALIGCGFFAVNQMHAWQDVEGAEIAAICDRDPDRLRVVGDQFGIERRYSDAAEMMRDGGFDFVDIATTVNSHRALVEMAASHRLPVICQKPFAPTLGDAKAMVAACNAAGVPLMIHENFRWQTPIQAVRKALDATGIGTPFWGRFSFRSGYDVFSGQPYLAEGARFIIEDLGIHTLDIARYILGDVTTLTARTTRVNPAIKGEDVATILLDHENGATSVVDVSYATKASVEPFPETLIELDGTEGSLRLMQGYRLEITNASGTKIQDVSPALLPWASRPWHNIQESVLAIQQHWTETLASGAETSTSGADNLKTFALVEAAYESAATLKPVAIGPLIA